MTLSSPPIYLGELNGTILGDFRLVASDLGLLAVEWADAQPELDAFFERIARPVQPDEARLAPFTKQLGEYLEKKRQEFTFPIDWESLRPFQQKAMKAVFKIPYGEIRTYSEIANEIGHPKAFRAVGRANATNPMPIVIPCHRLIGTDGKLHGYGGGQGLPTKEWLLKWEGAVLS